MEMTLQWEDFPDTGYYYGMLFENRKEIERIAVRVMKSLPARERLLLEAKVPPVCKRSTCTLSALISLNAELMALRHEPLSPGRICSKAIPAS